MSHSVAQQHRRLRRRALVIGGATAAGVVTAVVLLRQPTPTPPAQDATQRPIAVAPTTRTSMPPHRTVIETDHTSGSFLGLSWRTASVTVTAGRSVASASALGIGAAKHTPADTDQPCVDLITSEHHDGDSPTDPTVTISVADTTATIQIHGPGDSPPQRITVVLATCPLDRPHATDPPSGDPTPSVPPTPSTPRRPGGMRPISN